MSEHFDEHLRNPTTLEQIYVGRAFAYLDVMLKRPFKIDVRAHEHNRLRGTPDAQRWVYYEAGSWWSVTRKALAEFGRSLGDLDLEDAAACSRAYDHWCLSDWTWFELETAQHLYGGRS